MVGHDPKYHKCFNIVYSDSMWFPEDSASSVTTYGLTISSDDFARSSTGSSDYIRSLPPERVISSDRDIKPHHTQSL